MPSESAQIFEWVAADSVRSALDSEMCAVSLQGPIRREENALIPPGAVAGDVSQNTESLDQDPRVRGSESFDHGADTSCVQRDSVNDQVIFSNHLGLHELS